GEGAPQLAPECQRAGPPRLPPARRTETGERMTVPIPATIRQLLACPRCHGALRDEPAGATASAPAPASASSPLPPSTPSGASASEQAGLVCDACQLRF